MQVPQRCWQDHVCSPQRQGEGPAHSVFCACLPTGNEALHLAAVLKGHYTQDMARKLLKYCRCLPALQMAQPTLTSDAEAARWLGMS